MKTKLEKLKSEILEKLDSVKDKNYLQELEQQYFSRKGELSQLLRGLKDLSEDTRKELGEMANNVKRELSERFVSIKASLENSEDEVGGIDPTLPGDSINEGHLNPITIVQYELEDLFTSMGFIVADTPELDSDYYNFTALNMPSDHPARDMQDTFYVDIKNEKGEYDLLMRTHTSAGQVRLLEKYGAPLRVVIPGRCFRNEATDARHEHTFYQFEGLVVDRKVNFANLKSLLETVGKKLFGPDTKLRMRPKLYPFVEPGNNGEYTCFLCGGEGCRVCKHSGWLEIVGAGLVHPNVLRAAGLDPEEYSGLAFGFGLNRLAMLKYNINDIRLFNSGDLKFTEQF